MRIAVCYDYFKSKGGAELVVLEIARILNADIYTLVFDKNKTFEYDEEKIIELGVTINSSPFIQTQAAQKFKNLELSEYDLIISSGNWAKHIINKNDPKKIIHYEHTPPRILYDLREKIREDMPFWKRIIFDFWIGGMIKQDLESSKKHQKIITNSKNVQKRIIEYYDRESQIIYPFVDTKKFKNKKGKNYFFSIQRIASEKRLEIQIEAFRKAPKENLIIAGPISNNRYYEKLLVNLPKNVKFVGSISEAEKVRYYSECKAVIQTAIDEDFGIVPIEAAAAKKPCLAVNEGGFKETIIDRKTGVLFNKPYVKNLSKIIQNFNNYKFDKGSCSRQAEKFSKKRFKKEILELIRDR